MSSCQAQDTPSSNSKSLLPPFTPPSSEPHPPGGTGSDTIRCPDAPSRTSHTPVHTVLLSSRRPSPKGMRSHAPPFLARELKSSQVKSFTRIESRWYKQHLTEGILETGPRKRVDHNLSRSRVRRRTFCFQLYKVTGGKSWQALSNCFAVQLPTSEGTPDLREYTPCSHLP